MLSNHYPLAFATEYNWLIAALVFLMGVTIRHFFNTMHAGKGMVWWTWGVTVLLFLAIMWISTAPLRQTDFEIAEARPLTVLEQRYASAEGFAEVEEIVLGRCSMCHAREPAWDGIGVAPKNVLLETPAEIAGRAREIFLQAGLTDAMPPANVSWMEPEERRAIVRWYLDARQTANNG